MNEKSDPSLSAHEKTQPQSVPGPVGASGRRLPTAGIALLAAVLYVLLLDAAVETFLAGSRVRWIVLGIVAAYLAISTVLRRRLSLATSASASSLVLLGLLALTVWWADGTSLGLTVLRQPTSTVLAVVTTVAILVAASIVVRWKFLPTAGKLVVGLLALYALVAMAWAIVARTPYPDLFHGGSLWTGLPFWLQGAFVGPAILVPAALLGLTLSALRRGVSRPRPAAVAGALFLTTLVAIGAAASGPSRFQVQPAVSDTARAAPTLDTEAGRQAALEPIPPSDSPEDVAAPYRAALARVRETIDYSALQVEALRSKLGPDPATIAGFVRDTIRFEPYAGALRGARGTLLARAGNATDRALLVAALLGTEQHRVRFAEGLLSAIQAEELVRLGYKQASGLAPPGVPRQEVLDRAESHFLLLGDTLHAAGFRMPPGDAGRWQRTVGEAQRHVWVQLEDDGRWIDIDPTPGLEFGRSLVTAQRVTASLDATFFYSVQFSVELEVVEQGQRRSRTILQHAVSSTDLAGTPLGLFHDVADGKATVCLLVGDRLARGSSFDVAASEARGGLLSLPGMGEEAGGSVSPTGEWLRVHVVGPSFEREVSYTLFDTIGPARRAQGIMEGESAFVPNALEAVLGIVVATGNVELTLPYAVLADVGDPVAKPGVACLLSTMAFSYLVTRGSMPTSPWQPGPWYFLDSPNILIVRAQPPDDREPALAIDLTLKGYRLLLEPNSAERAPFCSYLFNGVLDHTVERALLGSEVPGSCVGVLFETAMDRDISLQVLTSQTPNPPTDLTADGQQRASAALKSRQMVVVPSRRPPDWGQGDLGWWTVDPTTGWTEDTTESSRHQAAPERAAQERETSRKVQAVCYLSLEIFFVALPVIAEVEGVPPAVRALAKGLQETRLQTGMRRLVQGFCGPEPMPRFGQTSGQMLGKGKAPLPPLPPRMPRAMPRAPQRTPSPAAPNPLRNPNPWGGGRPWLPGGGR